MIYSIQELKDKICLLVKDEPVYSVILFGSYAKGIADSNSDIDLVIDSHGQLKGFDFFALLENLTESFCKKIDLISKDQIVKESTLFNAKWRVYYEPKILTSFIDPSDVT